MADLNEVRLIGRLTRDPELRSTQGGQYVCSFGIATGRKFKGQDGVLKEETTFADITCWGRLAEICSQYLNKGKLTYVGGRLKLEQWTDQSSGQKRSKLSVTAENVQFLEPKPRDQQEHGAAPTRQHQQYAQRNGVGDLRSYSP